MLAKQHGWAGHVARMPQEMIASEWANVSTLEDWHLAQAVHTCLGQSTGARWRHSERGRKRHWETTFGKVLGDGWRSLAQDRKLWRLSKSYFVWHACSELLGHGHRVFGLQEAPPVMPDMAEQIGTQQEAQTNVVDARDLQLPHRTIGRRICCLALQSLRSGLQLQFVGDSQVIVDAGMGRANLIDKSLQEQVGAAQESIRQLLQKLEIRPPQGQELVVQTPRSDNTAADAAANRALDEGSFTDWNLHSCLRFVAALANDEHREYGMLWSFDGASRGNPGAASYGVTAWWGTWSLDGFQAKDAIFT